MQVDLNEKVAVVTGAAHGIGKSIALSLAANGASVVVNDLEGQGSETRDAIMALGSPCRLIYADVRDSEQVDRLVSETESELGPIDILIANAGVNTPGEQRRPIYEYEEKEWRRVIGVDLHGLYTCCRAVTPGMVQRKKGVIVTISSTMGIVPIRMQLAYAAAKAAVINFTRSIALELGPFGIRANTVAPGSTLTEQTKKLFYNPEKQKMAESLLSHVPLGRPAEQAEIASAVLFLASPASSYITGAVLAVDGGWTAGFARHW